MEGEAGPAYESRRDSHPLGTCAAGLQGSQRLGQEVSVARARGASCSLYCLLWTSRLVGGDPGELMMAETWWESCMREGECVQMDVCILKTVIIVAAAY